MNVREYLVSKYSVDVPTTMTKAEAKVFGIPYPLQHGWLACYGNTQITDGMRNRLITSHAARNKTYSVEALSVFGVTAHESSRPTKAQKRREKRKAKADRKIDAFNSLGISKQALKHEEFARSGLARRAEQGPTIAQPKRNTSGVYVRGVSVASADFLSTYEWRAVRMQALKRYGPICQCCGASPATGAVMNVDHIKPRKLFPHLALDVDNLQVLCHECNHGKGNWDMTDWRPCEADDDALAHMRSIAQE